MTDLNVTCQTSPTTAIAWGCNFEGGMCNWTKATDRRLDWQLTNGKNMKYGPQSDHTISKCKCNIYLVMLVVSAGIAPKLLTLFQMNI